MTADEFPAESLNRILVTVETIEESLGILARKQQISREDFKADSDARDIVERRFVKLTEASIDIGEELVKYERGQPPASNPESMRALGELEVLSPTNSSMSVSSRSASVPSEDKRGCIRIIGQRYSVT